jgi:hypothetical protein
MKRTRRQCGRRIGRFARADELRLDGRHLLRFRRIRCTAFRLRQKPPRTARDRLTRRRVCSAVFIFDLRRTNIRAASALPGRRAASRRCERLKIRRRVP